MAAVSKINQLPDELLALIFSPGIRNLSSDEHQPLLALICSVCRHWRNVAIEASELWTTIHISLERHIPAAQAFLERSKGRLIDLDIKALNADSVSSAREAAVITAPHISRVRTLAMTVAHFSTYTIFSDAYHFISATNLTSLSVNVIGYLWPLPGPFPLFASANSLCHFNTQGHLINVVSSRTSLTTLELSNYSPTHADIKNLFFESPCLETLILHGFDTNEQLDFGNEDDTPFIITVPTSLKSLAVSLYHPHSNGTGSCDCVLSSLCIPNLEYLEVVGNTVLDIGFNVHFGELAKLQTLRIQRCAVTLADKEFFLSLKELRHLELVDMSSELDIQHITGISPDDPPSSSFSSFPHLSSVFFSTEGEYTQSAFQLLQLAERRVAAGCPRFTLEVEQAHSEEFSKAIQSFIQDVRICVAESDGSAGLIQSMGDMIDDHLFGDQDEEEMDEDVHEWEPEYEEWGEEEYDAFESEDEFYGEDPPATYM